MFNFFKKKPKEEAIQKHLKEVDKMRDQRKAQNDK